MALCREKHQECHRIGQQAFEERYHVHGVLCEYHNDAESNEEPEVINYTSNIKTMRHNAEMGLLGVQFKSPVPGCNEKGVIVYRMDADEYNALLEMPDPKQTFMDTVYGKREIVEM